MILLNWLTCFIGFWLLCLSTPRHRKVFSLIHLTNKQDILYRVSGLSFIFSGLAIAIYHHGPGDGILLWVGVLTMTALLVATTLIFKQIRK